MTASGDPYAAHRDFYRDTLPLWYFSLSVIVGVSVCLFGLPFAIGGYSVRPERLLAIVSLLFLFAHCFSSRRREIVRPEYLVIVAWVLLAFLASLLSSSPSQSLRHWLDLSLAMSLFISAIYWRLEHFVFSVSKTIYLLILLMGGGGLTTALLRALNLVDNESFFAQFITPTDNYVRIRMTMYEPNLYGALMMIFSLLSVALFRRERKTSWIMLLLSHAGLILSASRGPIVAYVVGLLIYYFCIGQVGKYFKSLFTFLCVASPLVLFPDTLFNSGLYSRIDSIGSRLVMYQLAWFDIKESVLFGSGIYSFSYLHPEASALVGSVDNENAVWISNMLVAVFHDTGLAGLGLFVSGLYVVLSRAYKAIADARSHGCPVQPIKMASAWLAAGCAIVISSLATSAYSLGAFWIVMALISIIPRALRDVEGGVSSK